MRRDREVPWVSQLRSNDSRKGDRSGTLSSTWKYWALFRSEDPSSSVWGCWHPVVSGTGDFAGASACHLRGHPKEINQIAYIGNLTLKGKAKEAKAAREGRRSAADLLGGQVPGEIPPAPPDERTSCPWVNASR